MNLRVQYTTAEDRQLKVDENSDKFLLVEEVIMDGNFLTFSATKPLENQLQDLNNTTNMILLKQEGII